MIDACPVVDERLRSTIPLRRERVNRRPVRAILKMPGWTSGIMKLLLKTQPAPLSRLIAACRARRPATRSIFLRVGKVAFKSRDGRLWAQMVPETQYQMENRENPKARADCKSLSGSPTVHQDELVESVRPERTCPMIRGRETRVKTQR